MSTGTKLLPAFFSLNAFLFSIKTLVWAFLPALSNHVYIEDRDPVPVGRFHTDFGTGVFGKPFGQLLKAFGEGREAGLLVLGKTVGVGNTDTGIYPGFVDIKPQQFLQIMLMCSKRFLMLHKSVTNYNQFADKNKK